MSEPVYPALHMPAGVTRRAVTLWSGGLALDADLYRPTTVATDAALPAVVLCHGWGGSKGTAERYAAMLASAGMVTLTFTQSGWFASASPCQVLDDDPTIDADNQAVTRVRFIHELVDPFAWVTNARAAVDYLEGEPNVDPMRIGLWGTSFGGGVAVYLAAHDHRIAALAVQVPAVAPLSGPAGQFARRRAIDTARGQAPALPQGVDTLPGLAGTPNLATLAHFDPMAEVHRLTVPTLIIDAGDEEMFPSADNGARAAEILAAVGVDVEYRVVPGITHYGIYFDGYESSSAAAYAWFERHLQ